MKTQNFCMRRNYWIITNLVIIFLMIFTSCGIKSTVRQFDNRMGETIRTMDNAIAALTNESAQWQVIVTNLEKEISKDVQSTIRTELNDLTRSAVLSVGSELRCNAEFMRIKVRRELIDLRNSLAISFNKEIAKSPFADYQIALIPTEEIRPFICDIVPSAIDLSLDPERRTKIDIYGFDLRSYPISVSYNTVGLFQAKTAEGPIEFLDHMYKRKFKTIAPTVTDEVSTSVLFRDPVIYDSITKNRVINATSFNLINPAQYYFNDISQCISVISDFHAVIDLAGSCANIPPNTMKIFLSWDNAIQSEIPILTHEKVLECTTTDISKTFPDLVFVPKKYGDGDAEFKSNGPCIRFSMNLRIDPSKKILNAVVFMDAWECPDDFSRYTGDKTEAWETRTIPLYNVATDDPDAIIIGFDLAPSISDEYIDTDNEDDVRGYGSGGPAYEIVFTGDTDGDEASTRTKAVIKFNPIKIKIQKCEYK